MKRNGSWWVIALDILFIGTLIDSCFSGFLGAETFLLLKPP
jgi:hypothetical protein